MTKSEVRTVSIAKLQLQPDDIVYDIGAGTGWSSVPLPDESIQIFENTLMLLSNSPTQLH